MTLHFFAPDREGILAGLARVNDDRDLVRGFYPLLAMRAGQRFTPLSLVNMVVGCVRDFTVSDPQTRRLLTGQIRQMIGAFIPYNPEAFVEALNIYEAMLHRASAN